MFIESKEINLKGPSLNIAQGMSYNWTILTSSHRKISFYGKYDELLKQNFKFEELVTGQCEIYQSQMNNSELPKSSLIYFSNTCVSKAYENKLPFSFKTWMYDNKMWLIPAGLTLGAGIWLLSTNQVLVLHLPF